MGKHGASLLRRVCTRRSHIGPLILRSAPGLLRRQHLHRDRQCLHTPSDLGLRMGYVAHNSPTQRHGGGAPRPHLRRVPYCVWRPENGIVFSTARTPGSGSPSSSTYQPTYRPIAGTYSVQQPLVFRQCSSFDQAPSFGQAQFFDNTASLRQAPSFEQAPSSGVTASLSQDAPVLGQTPSFAPWLPSLKQQPASGETPSEQPSLGQSSSRWPVFVQPSFSQPSRPMSVFSKQSKGRFIHSSSRRTTSPHGAQAPALEKTEPTHTGALASGQAETVEELAQNAEETEVLPPETDLDFKMSRTLFEKARKAAPGTPGSYWSYTLYRNSPARAKDTGAVSDAESVTSDTHSVHSSVTNSAEKAGNGARAEPERVKVHYCRSRETTERVCAQYFAGEPLLGFDLEWMADAAKWQGPRMNVCLLQLASPSRIGLFHLSLFPTRDLMTPTLRKILETPDIMKVGVFIKGDATRLRNHLAVNMQGLMELSHLHRLVKYSKTGEHHLITRRLVSLATQVEENLKLPLYKGQDVRSSNWFKPLRMDQISYSASDAYASVQLFAVLEKERLSLDPTPPRPAFAELNLPIKLASGAELATADESAAEDAELAISEEEGETVEASSRGRKSPTSTKQKSISAGTTDKATKSARAVMASKASPDDARIVASDQWLDHYRESKAAPVKATPACLRAYHLWHTNTDLDAEMVAALLRDPPLKTMTVVVYVLSAVQLEKLPYDKERCRAELMDLLPPKTRLKYRTLAKACGYDLTAPDPALT